MQESICEDRSVMGLCYYWYWRNDIKMVQTLRNVAKRQKVGEYTSCMESVLFNSDSFFKIASYLPADGLLNLALTCRRFGIAPVSDGDDSLSLVDETARRIVQNVATEEQLNALPGYDEDNWLCKYNYLQSLRSPLTFDQLVGGVEYVEGNKSRVVTNNDNETSFHSWNTAFSNNIMMAGKHYVSFEVCNVYGMGLFLGAMRPGEAMQTTLETNPLQSQFYHHFTQRNESRQYNNIVNCCMFSSFYGYCFSSAWEGNAVSEDWDGMERLSGSFQIGMLLDLDEGTLSVYKDERKLGVMKRGLAGHYCWAVSLAPGSLVTIKRGTVPAS